MSERAIPAAQYLRMSTEHQRYSLAAQAEAIDTYATAHGYELSRSYFDPGESGLTFEKRLGLQALLSAALDPNRAFDAILVLDVSRWGRFQDIDQAAHYEYLCRNAGVRVIYCAEPFGDDDSPTSSILKALKRIMAAQFSQELSASIRRARLRQARLGFYQGGAAVYGVRRVVVDPDGRARLELAPGQQKAIAGDRVVLRPGPPNELAVIRLIFRRYVRGGRGLTTIARELNAKGVPSVAGRCWLAKNVASVLRNELAIGLYVTNKSDQSLGLVQNKRPADQWLRVRVFDPIVQPSLFRKAQDRLRRGEREAPSKPLMLKAMRRLLRQEGRLTARLLNRSSETHGAQTYRRYFGSLEHAYDLIGYVPLRTKRAPSPAKLDRMLELLRQAHRRHGYLAAGVIDADPSVPALSTYVKHFGSLRRAYQLAGLPHAQDELLRQAHRRSIARGTASAVRGRPFGQRCPVSDEQLLSIMRDTYERRGDMSRTVLDAEPGGPRASLYQVRFGSLMHAYVRAGLPAEFFDRYRLRRFARRIGWSDGAEAPSAPEAQ